jgi:flagellar biosynthetic protein FlhB
MADASDRVIPATPRRRDAARKQGAMPTAAVLAGVAMAATALVLLPGWITLTVPAAIDFFRRSLVAAIRGPADPLAEMVPPSLPLVVPTVAVVLAAATVGLALRAVLDGSAWRLGRAAPAWQRIDPLQGLSRMFSGQTLAAIVTNTLGLAAIVAAACFAAAPIVGLVAAADATAGVERWLGAVRALTLPTVAAAAAVAAAQWGLARLRFEKRIRMTPQEFQEEMKGMEADPKVRLRREQGSRSHTAR